MANAGAIVAEAYLKSRDINVSVLRENILSTKWRVDDTNIQLIMDFSKDVHDVHIVGRNFLECSKMREVDVIKCCNILNRMYRWVKFSVDLENQEVVVDLDAVIQPDSCGEEVYELMMRMLNIVAEAYPKFMNVMWG